MTTESSSLLSTHFQGTQNHYLKKATFGVGLLGGIGGCGLEAYTIVQSFLHASSSLVRSDWIALGLSIGLVGISALGLYQVFTQPKAIEASLIAVKDEAEENEKWTKVAEEVSKIIKTLKIEDRDFASTSIQENIINLSTFAHLQMIEQYLSAQIKIWEQKPVEISTTSTSVEERLQKKIKQLQEKSEDQAEKINGLEFTESFLRGQIQLIQQHLGDSKTPNPKSNKNLTKVQAILSNLTATSGSSASNSDSVSLTGSSNQTTVASRAASVTASPVQQPVKRKIVVSKASKLNFDGNG